MEQAQLYNDKMSFQENKELGPFGDYDEAPHQPVERNEASYNFFNVDVDSPFGIAAGPLPTPRHIGAALLRGFDIVTLKSVRTDTFPVNQYPHIRPLSLKGSVDPASQESLQIAKLYSEPLAAANSFGIPSVKPEEWQPDMEASFGLPRKGQALLVAFQGTARGKGKDDFIDDHVLGIDLIKQTGANTIEINLSCPNEGEEVLACFDTDITERIVNAVRDAHPDINLLVKLAYFSDKEQLKDLVQRTGPLLDGISVINTIPMSIVDQSGNEVFPGRPKAGVSGAPIKEAGIEMVKSLKQFREELDYSYKILGMGGVLSAADFHEYREAGADVVMAVTGAMWNPGLAAEIKVSL